MAYKPYPVQGQAHRAILIDGYKRAVLYWGRRVGKTQWAIQQLMLSCMMNQGQHHMVFKEYTQAETVAWNQYLHTIPKALIKDTNKSSLTITFHYIGNKETGEKSIIKMPGGEVIEIAQDHNRPPSSIRLLGSDKAESHRGGESQGMVYDEYQDQDPYNWDTVYKPFFATTGGWAVFMGTAKDIDHWNELLDRAELSPRWYFSKTTWRSNPKILPEWVEDERKEAEAEGKLGPFLQEMELIPFSQQGAVYPMFNTKIHVVPADKVPEEGTDYIGLDFGFAEGHPMAACFIRITRDDIWYQWDEIFGTGIQIDDLIAEIKLKMAERRLSGIIADSARPDLIEYMAAKGLPMIPSPKQGGAESRIVSGIALLRKRLRPKIQIIGEPKPNYYVAINCRNTIHQWKHYRYKEPKLNRLPDEKPEKKDDDTCFVAGTMVATRAGARPIEQLSPGDYVLTPFGESKVISARSTGKRAVRDYGIFVATPDHHILTSRGIVPVDVMRYDDFIWQENSPQTQLQSILTSTEYLIGAILSPKTAATDFIFNALLTRNLAAKLGFSTETFGSSIMGRFLQGCMSITGTGTMTTRLRGLSSLTLWTMQQPMKETEKRLLQSILHELENLQRSGTEAKLAEFGIVSTEKEFGRANHGTKRHAQSAGNFTRHLSQIVANTVILTAKPQLSEDAEVHNLAVEDGMYFANGVLVSNCDAIRYLELFFKFGGPKEEKVPQNSVLKSTNDYGLL